MTLNEIKDRLDNALYELEGLITAESPDCLHVAYYEMMELRNEIGAEIWDLMTDEEREEFERKLRDEDVPF